MLGRYRVVGRLDRDLPEDSIFPLDTQEQKNLYNERLFRMKSSRLMPVYRLGPGESRVKRFATLEEANRDWEACAMRAVNYRKTRNAGE